jgi:hypothetical protein
VLCRHRGQQHRVLHDVVYHRQAEHRHRASHVHHHSTAAAWRGAQQPGVEYQLVQLLPIARVPQSIALLVGGALSDTLVCRRRLRVVKEGTRLTVKSSPVMNSGVPGVRPTRETAGASS